MRDLPKVPNWIQWSAAIAGLIFFVIWLSKALPDWIQGLAAGLAVVGVIVVSARLAWRKFFADRWAKINSRIAIERAETLVVQFRIVQELLDDPVRLQAISSSVVFDIIFSILLLVMGNVLIAASIPVLDISLQFSFPGLFGVIPPANFVFENAWAIILSGIATLFIFRGFSRFITSWIKQETLVRPLTDWDNYLEKTLERIRFLLDKGEMNDDEIARFIDDVINRTEEGQDGDNPEN